MLGSKYNIFITSYLLIIAEDGEERLYKVEIVGVCYVMGFSELYKAIEHKNSKQQ